MKCFIVVGVICLLMAISMNAHNIPVVNCSSRSFVYFGEEEFLELETVLLEFSKYGCINMVHSREISELLIDVRKYSRIEQNEILPALEEILRDNGLGYVALSKLIRIFFK